MTYINSLNELFYHGLDHYIIKATKMIGGLLSMIKIIRYSTDGFRPQKQEHHIKSFESLEKININDYPEFLRSCISENQKAKTFFYKEHFDDLQEGIWFFLDGHKNRQSLNHLKKLVPCWEAEIEDDILVYSCNLDAIVPLTNDCVEAFGCYLPKRLLDKIHNIHRKKKSKEKENLLLNDVF